MLLAECQTTQKAGGQTDESTVKRKARGRGGGGGETVTNASEATINPTSAFGHFKPQQGIPGGETMLERERKGERHRMIHSNLVHPLEALWSRSPFSVPLLFALTQGVFRAYYFKPAQE